MERMKKLVVLAVLLAAAALVLSTCSNPVDLLAELEVEVMKANDRYLEIENLDAARMSLSDPDVSPSADVVVVFDRPVDGATLSGITLLENGTAVSVKTELNGSTLRVTKDPYFDNEKDYALTLAGVQGTDGAVFLEPVSWSFHTGTAPAANITLVDADGAGSPADGYTNGTSITISMSTNVEAKYYLIKNTPIVESDYGEPIWTHITTTPFSTTHAIESGDGPKVVYIMLRDETGNIYSTMYEKDIYLDTALPDAPTITITYSGTHYYYVKGTQTISASSSDSVGIKDIKIHVNTVLKGASSVSPCSCTWDTTLYSNNTTYPVRVDVYDLAGNSATATETRKVDNEPPTKAPNFTSMPGTLINDPTPTWTWQAAFESGGNGIFSTKFGGALYGSESTETSYTAPTLPNGSFVFRVREHDYAGNYGPEKDYTVTIDLLPPGTPNLTYSSVTQTIFKFDWTSGGGGNGLYDFEMNDSTPDAYQNQNVLTYTSLPLPDGTHYFYVKEHDSAGNLSSYASAKITINITTVSPDNGAATYKSSVLLDWPDPMYLYFDDVEISFNGSNWTRVAEDITAGSYQQTMSTGTIKYYWRIIRTGKIGTTILGPYQFTNHF